MVECFRHRDLATRWMSSAGQNLTSRTVVSRHTRQAAGCKPSVRGGNRRSQRTTTRKQKEPANSIQSCCCTAILRMKIKSFQVSTSTFPLSSLSLRNPTFLTFPVLEQTASFKEYNAPPGMTRIPSFMYSTWRGAIFTEDPQTWVSHKRPGCVSYVSVCWQ